MLNFTTKTCVMVPASNIPVQAILLLCVHASTLLAGGRTVTSNTCSEYWFFACFAGVPSQLMFALRFQRGEEMLTILQCGALPLLCWLLVAQLLATAAAAALRSEVLHFVII